MSHILFDIGGTKTRVGVSNDLRTLDSHTSFKTPTDPEKAIELFREAVTGLTSEPVIAAAGGIRGRLNEDKSAMVVDSLLTKWQEVPLQKMLEKALATSVLLENDAALAGLGEANYGAGEGSEIVVYHTVSTGVGGAKIENGVIDQYHTGFEPGHQILDIDHTILGEEIEPTLENLISGAAIEARTGSKPFDIPQSDALWDQLALFLAHGLRNSILYWSPDVIVLGGSMILGDPRIELSAVTTHLNEVMDEISDVPLLLEAKLGDEAGLYGGMALLNQNL